MLIFRFATTYTTIRTKIAQNQKKTTTLAKLLTFKKKKYSTKKHPNSTNLNPVSKLLASYLITRKRLFGLHKACINSDNKEKIVWIARFASSMIPRKG
ncbi:unnamed protein product [Caenorhabditis angaria]|uniref:Uncharacterized protein n=1 Tax=Caenorhabditis angaria TaxID=860376 RepID=A0A9P1J1U3_9PELO|nr:unnamed protein product [Caenorhabditis angaria]